MPASQHLILLAFMLVDASDKDLYEAKRNGHNQVAVARSEFSECAGM
ncbi:hypothetical protein SDC9_175253 [bioreactor metagenome]|uniref:Uncharacterized protein n=1 Tax=bioreactor metagenome TaxID=1076179 RepID=A0A645GPI9_9ZZZZ